MATIDQSTYVPGHTLKPRRIGFTFNSSQPAKKYFVDGDIASSYLVALMSAGFPEGEQAFIRSVKAFSDQITDPELKRRVAGFIGQEVTHAREHTNLNEQLDKMGYPVRATQKLGELFMGAEKLTPPLLLLAMTAAGEHFTAIMAEQMLESDELQAMAYDPEVRGIMNWHALEELEHKSVAFDVFRAVGGSEFIRLFAMVYMLSATPALTYANLILSILADPTSRKKPLTTLRSLIRLPRSPMFVGVGPALLRYLKPGFHPEDIDTRELQNYWHTKLFGSEGLLTDHLKQSPAKKAAEKN
jgi:predicted metal-dependent hydrolase